MIRSDIQSVSHPPNPVKVASTSSAFQIIQRVKAVQTDLSLTPTERVMLAHLMLSAGQSGETCWPHEKLARAIGISGRQSQRITAKLDAKGYLKSIQQGLKRSNRYLMPWNPAFPEPTPMSYQESPEPTAMAVPEPTPMAVPLEKEALVKDNPQKLASRGVILFEQQPQHLQALKVELQALREAFLGFVKADAKLNHQTVKNIWESAIANCPEMKWNGLILWLRWEARDGRRFNNWGGVVDMVRNELDSDRGGSIQRLADRGLEKSEPDMYECFYPDRREEIGKPLAAEPNDRTKNQREATRYDDKAEQAKWAAEAAMRERWSNLCALQYAHPALREWMSRGDGHDQFLCADPERQERMIQQIENGRHPIQLGIPPGVATAPSSGLARLTA